MDGWVNRILAEYTWPVGCKWSAVVAFCVNAMGSSGKRERSLKLIYSQAQVADDNCQEWP
jgi:signal-transduction protein with cAMP-binding, CBS, and nucleotidyltransferase domain